MNFEKRTALYKHKGTKTPKKLFEVWEDTKGEFFIDFWIIYDKEKQIYELDETRSLQFFNVDVSKFEEIKTKWEVIQNVYLQIKTPQEQKDLETLKILIKKYPKHAQEFLNETNKI